MSHIDDLITQLCPHGVKKIAIKNLIGYEQPTKYLVSSKEYDSTYSTPVLTAGQTFILGYTNEAGGIYPASKSEPVIIFDDFTTAHKWVDFPFKAKSGAMKMLRPVKNAEINIRFFFYLLNTIEIDHSQHARYWISEFAPMEIPVPPLKIQEGIVRILDTFTELEAELEAELESRYLQMQHYARAMTEIFSKDELTTLSLAEFAEIGTGSSNTQDAIEGAEYPFYVRSQSPLSIDRYEFDEQAVLTAGDGVGVGKVFHFANGKYALHQRAYRVKPDDSIVDTKFLFYFMKNNFGLYLDSTAVHASVTSLRRPMFEKFEVTFPSLESQRTIVHFLDLLEAYIGDQNGGIHAELHARRKQYEYYRNKLLTFKAFEAS